MRVEGCILILKEIGGVAEVSGLKANGLHCHARKDFNRSSSAETVAYVHCQ